MTTDLERWLEETFPLPSARVVEILERTPNTLVRVDSGGGTHWLRLATQSEVAQATLEEAAALLFREAEGDGTRAATPSQAEALGALVAQIHSAPVEMDGPARRIDRALLVDEPIRYVEPWLRKQQLDAAVLRAAADDAMEVLQREEPALWSSTVPCHGDVHLENVRFADDAPTLFDFECWGRGPALYDLACYWRKNVDGGADAGGARAAWEALLRGYRSVRALGEPSQVVVAALATMRAIWVMAMPAAPGARWGGDWLEDRAYLVAHFGFVARYRGLAVGGG